MSKLTVAVPSTIDAWPYVYVDSPQSQTLSYAGPDSEDLFLRNCKNLDTNWIYRNTPVDYHFNRHGLRMKKDIEQVDDAYILFSGTSYGMGIGIPENHRYSERISSHLNLDFINFCGPTFTTKMQVISFFNLLKTNYHLPKILVIEYPDHKGYTFYSNSNFICLYDSYLKHLTDYKNIEEIYKQCSSTDILFQESNIYRNMLLATCDRLGIKVIELSFHPNDQFTQENNILGIDAEYKEGDINTLLARDVRTHNGKYTGHPGTGIHNIITQKVLDQL
jgi:hypothetical protein